jgi:hypothetical protein
MIKKIDIYLTLIISLKITDVMIALYGLQIKKSSDILIYE